MLHKMFHALYRWLLRLHPRVFRERFSEEMMWIFEEARATHGTARLFADGVISLLRQWATRQESWKSRMMMIAARSGTGFSMALLSWEYWELPEQRLPVRRWMQGGIISVALLALAWSATGGSKYRPISLAGMLQSHGASIAHGVLPPVPRSFGTPFAESGSSAELYSRQSAAQDFSQEQYRQPEKASRAAIEDQNVPPSAIYLTNSQGAAVETPRTPAGEQFAGWLKAFNSGDRTQLEAFLTHYKNPNEHEVNRDLGFRELTGGFELRKMEESSATKISGLVQERDSDQFARFTLEVEPEAPHRITQLDLRAIPRPAEFPIERLSQSELLRALRDKLQKDSAADKFAGAVLVAKDGKPISTSAYGMADREKKIPNTLDTKFRIGSMNKMFTATSILQLAQAGKIKLSDPLGKYISDYPNKDAAAKVTIEQLLMHTGGTGDIFGPEFNLHRQELRTLEDYVNLYGKRDLKFEPGSRWEYSNYGFLILGVVIERVSGKSYYGYVKDSIYGPAGMIGSGSLPEDQSVPNRSIGYTRMSGKRLHPNTDTLPYRGTSAGGGYSTVEDLLRFANALKDHKLLNAQYTEMLTTGKVETPMGDKYAFGFMDENREGEPRRFGHGGGAPGMNGDLKIYPQSGYVIAVLSNLDPPAASRISDFVGNRLPKN